MENEQGCKILLIGGSGAVGKSTLAEQLALYYKAMGIIQVDDIRIALQQMVNPNEHPDLFAFVNNPNYLSEYSVPELLQKLLCLGKVMEPVLQKLIEKHIVCNEPAIFEGDSILPEMVDKIHGGHVIAVFLYDTKENLQKREQERGRGGRLDEEMMRRQIDFSFYYGEYIREQAEAKNLITIQASPIDTLCQRVIQQLEEAHYRIKRSEKTNRFGQSRLKE